MIRRRTSVPAAPTAQRSALVRPVPRGEGRAAASSPTPVQRHDLPLANWDVEIVFEDGSREVLYMHARDPIGAVRTASYTTEREWPAERLLGVRSINIRRV